MSLPTADRVLILDYKPASLKATFGGTRTYVRTLIQDLVASGFEVSYVINPGPAAEEWLGSLEPLGVRTAICDYAAADSIESLLTEPRRTIVHINSGQRVIHERFLRSPSVRSGQVRSIFTMHLPLPSALLGPKSSLKDYLPIGWRARTVRADARFVRQLSRIISVSGVHASALARELDMPRAAIDAIPNGVAVERFTPRTDSRNGDEVVVGGAGRLVAMKRFDRLIGAIAELAPTRRIRLRLAGSGPDEDKLRQQAVQQGIADQIDFLGSVADMPAFLQSLDVFAMTSDNEGLPYVQLEAMAAGLPSVVTDVGDLGRVVRDGVEGYVVPVHDQAAFVARLASLVDNVALRSQMARSARQRACDAFSQAASSQATLKVFQELANRP